METTTMGRVLVSAKLESVRDLYKAQDGDLPFDDVRSLEVTDALVDTGTTGLSLPRRMIDQLGLRQIGTRAAKTTAGVRQVKVFDAVRLTVQDREMLSDVTEVSDDCPVLIGQVPLEMLDFIVDPKHQRLLPNPDHGGEQMLEMY